MRLYRAVSQVELDDITTFGGFRLNAGSFVFGKWFALNRQDATAWGDWFASHDGLEYHVVETEIPDLVFNALVLNENQDNIGSAVFLEENHLRMLPGMGQLSLFRTIKRYFSR